MQDGARGKREAAQCQQREPKLSDAELVTLPVMRARLGFTSEARWLRHVRTHLRHLFPYLPGSLGTTSGYARPRA